METAAQAPGPRPRSRFAAGLPAVTAERIIDAAMELTIQRGLDSWTLRQLASAVDAYPAVIYHHVGDREAVVRAVLTGAIGHIPVPPLAESGPTDWRAWYRHLLADMRVVLRKYRGVADRFSLYGPLVTSASVLIDSGVRVLQEAGFGDESVIGYDLLLGTACHLISKEDDHLAQELIRPDPSEIYAAARDNDAGMPGLAALGERVYAVTKDPQAMADHFSSFYEYSIERALDGLAARLEVLKAQSGPAL